MSQTEREPNGAGGAWSTVTPAVRRRSRDRSPGPGSVGGRMSPGPQVASGYYTDGDFVDPRESSTGNRSPAPAIGNYYMSEARKFLKRSKWSVVRTKLIGPNNVRDVLKKELSKDDTPEMAALLASGAQYGSLPKPPDVVIAATDEETMPLSQDGTSVQDGPAEAKEPRKRSNPAVRLARYFWNLLLSRYLNLLLLFLPFGCMSYLLGWGPGYSFFLNFLGLIPLAAMLGDLTEEVAEHTGDTIGGIVNASFGNLVEMIIGVQALFAGEYRVVQASMLGSVLSNLLLVTGSCFLLGGMFNKEQTFNPAAGVANVSLLLLATLGVILPTPFGASYSLDSRDTLLISRVSAFFLLFMYLQLIFFQMVTHKHLFEPEEDEGDEEEDGEDEDEKLGLWDAMLLLACVALLTGVFSEMLVDSIDGMSKELRISKVFVGVILLPVVGNATEHMAAVSVAVRNRMELAMGIAVGSATQVAIFVIPFLVLTGWAIGRDLTLEFPAFEVMFFVMSVIITIPVLLTANSNWLLGSFLITAYIFAGFAFWFEKDTIPFDV